MTKPDVFLTWLDDHPQCYIWLVAAVIAAGAALAIRSWLQAKPGDRPQPDWKWGLVLLAILLAGRWPSMMIPRELNPDESQLFASAHALTHDPVFWRSVDGHTAGPLDFFALVPAGWLGGWDSYAGVRVTALLLLAVSLTLIHQTLALVYPPRTVRFATFSAAVLEALTNSVDLLHYSTELIPVLWLSFAAYAAVRRWHAGGGPGWSGLGGLLLGAVPLSKLQPAPIALFAGLAWLWAEWRARGPERSRHLVYLLTGAVLPAFFFIMPVVIAGQWDNFIIPYVLINLGYVAAGDSGLSSLLDNTLLKSQQEDSLLHYWLPAMLLWCVLAFRLRLPADRAARMLSLVALAGTFLSVACVLRAGRPFLHYWQLVVPALTLLLGALLGNLAANGLSAPARWLMAACALALPAALGGYRLQKPNFFMGAFTYFETHPRNPVSNRILAHAAPGDTIATWGWSNYIYVETGLRQVTRDVHVAYLLIAGPYRDFYRDRYLADMLVLRPAIFVDSVGPCSIHFQAPHLKHDANFPELGALVRAYYVLVDEVDGAQIYRRRDLLASAPAPK